MKQDRNVPQTRGYRLTPKDVRAIQEERTPLYQLTPKGRAFVQDCNAKLGAIAEDENLPRPTTEKSHADLVNEEIDLYEQQTAKKPQTPQKNTLSKGDKLEMLMNCSARLQSRIDLYFKNYLQAKDQDSSDFWWNKVRAAQKADNRVLRKIGILFVDSQL